MKICIACSAGGHLTEITQLEKTYKKYPHFYLTFKRKDTDALSKKHKVYFVPDPKRNPLKLAINFFQSLYIYIRERPKAILTTGAGVVVPFCMISKFFGSKIIYIDSFCRANEISATGKALYHIADKFFVQWPELSRKYKKSIYSGAVF